MVNLFIFFFIAASFVSGQDVSESSEDEKASTHIPHLMTAASVIEATSGETVTLPCEVEDLGEYVKLWKTGRIVLFVAELKVQHQFDRFHVEPNLLRITNVQPKDSGIYICQISTNPPLEVEHTLNILYPPTVKPEPRDGFVTVKEGESVTLSCDAVGNPLPSITWKHAGRNYDIADESKFTISNALKSASGEYECIADNGVGDPASAVITVEVVSAPKVYPQPKNGVLVVKEGDEIEISCEATGDPLPVISWKTPGVDKAQKSRENNRIVINEAERSHAGAYECIANNSLGVFTSAIIRVNVLYPPEVRVQSSWIHAGEGTAVNMSCSVKGEPLPTVSWRRGEAKTIHPNDHYHIKSSGHHHFLQIRRLKEEDYGRYECVARNTLNTAAESIHIIGTPQVPMFIETPEGTSSGKFVLVWTVKSPSPIHEYSLIYRKKTENQEWKTVSLSVKDLESALTYSYELEGLEPGASYEAMVTARNKFGWSKQSDGFTFTTKLVESGAEVVVDIPKEDVTTEMANSNSNDELVAGRSPSQSPTQLTLLSSALLIITLAFFH